MAIIFCRTKRRADELEVFAVISSRQHRRIIRGTGYHGEDLAGGRLNSNDASGFSLHEKLSVFLQADVDSAHKVLPRD